MKKIINGKFVNFPDDDGITKEQIQSIINGTYSPTYDEDPVTKKQIDEILSSWDK